VGFGVLLGLVSACLGVAPVAADDSGRWGGTLEGRGDYYWERSTRVVVPEGKLTITTPSGVRVGAGYLMDAITSASIAASGATADNVGTELRQAVFGEVGKEIDLGDAQLDFTLLGTYSTESDYRSLVYALISSIAFDEKNTKVSLAVTRVQDRVLSNADPTFDRGLSGFTLGPTLEQVINPVLVLSVGYQFGYLDGFLANPYRRALIGPLPYPENHPSQRFRHAVSSRLAWFIPESNTSVHLMYSAYVDNWDIAALSPEIRIYQQLGDNWLLRPRYRFYDQTKAYFQRTGRYPAGWQGPVTSDPKMAAMRTHTGGLSVEYHLSLLAGTMLDFAKDTWLDIAFDRYWSTSTFGNGIIGTAGARASF
jgi:hypothetical protein